MPFFWRFITALLLMVAFCGQVASANTCSSSTDEFIRRYITIPQKPLSTVLVQRFVGPELSIRCLSVTTAAGPTCSNAAVPTLCYRKASDTLAALTCEALPQFFSNPNEKLTRGDRDGEDMVWIIKMDTSAQPASCFARTEEVRLLAFVRGKPESSIALFIVFLIVCVLVVLVAAALVAFACYQRSDQMDGAGAVAGAGPKLNYQGAQLNVAEPHMMQPNVERYLLPVRASGGVEDLSTYYNRIMNDPNYDPATDGVILDADGSRAPRSVKRIMRASPPRPGDGIDDGLQARHNEIRRQIADSSYRRRKGGSASRDGPSAFDRYGRRRGGGGYGDDDDDSGDDFDYDDPRNLLDINDPNGGEIVYDAAGRAIGRRRKRQRRNRGLDEDGSNLFPTQGGWSTFGDPDGDDDSDDPDGTGGRRRGPNGSAFFPGGDPNQSSRNIKFVPRWMEGNFGRGGDIPEPDTDEVPYDPMDNPLDQLTRGGPNNTTLGGGIPLARRLHKPVYNPNANVGAPTPVRHPSRNQGDPLSGSPRGNSTRRAVVGGRTPGMRGANDEDDMDGNDGPQNGRPMRRSGSRGFGPGNGEGPDGMVGTPRGGAGRRGSRPGGSGYASDNPGDAFQRGDVKLNSTKLSLDPASYADPNNMTGPNRSRRGSRAGEGGGADGPEGPRRAADGSIIREWKCKDCLQHVAQDDPSTAFCPVNGYRHF